MARIDSAYDYYVSTYSKQEVSRYDSHKKSDLRKVYNSIVKSNKESPLYKISNLEDAKKYAIDIKENAKHIQNVVASLSDKYGEFNDSFRKKVAISSDDKKVGVNYVGDGTESNSTDAFTVSVDRLASPQVNTGNYLKNDALSFVPGTYSFDLKTNASTYEFQFNVGTAETNRDILTKLNNLVNTSNLGLTSKIIDGKDNTSAMQLNSVQTGLTESEEALFTIAPSASAESIRAMNLLGINNVSSPAQNSVFRLNDQERSSLSNSFTINNAFAITLNAPTEGIPVQIGFKADTDSIADNIQSLLDVYNNIISVSEHQDDSEESGYSNKLFNDIASVARGQKTSLESIGLKVAPNGQLSINMDVLAEAVQPENAQNTFDILSKFRDSVGAKADDVAINPMNYVNKVVVAYKNPGHNFATPYISSIYSGLMMDDYV